MAEPRAKTRMEQWLAANKHKFGTTDGLPGEFHRECLFNLIKPGSTVGIITSHGSKLSGRVVMRGPAGWVFNAGGPHGTPAIADERNTIYVGGARL